MEENGASSYSYTLDLLLSCVCAVLFVCLLSLDAWNAFKRKAYWFPAQALVLSAPTIQLLSFVDKLNSSVHTEKNFGSETLWGRGADQLFVNTTRVMICVIIGCLLPGMASSSFTTMGSNIGALALTVIVHMLKSLLANVIFGCMDVEVDKAVIKACNKWAQEGNENAIFNAAFIARIAQGLKMSGGEEHSIVDAVVPEGSQVSNYPDATNEV